jgi:DNA helicase-2/ATP-dependent DNA helicase PcrA
MRWYADLHSHSRFARACSPQLNLPRLARACVEKGVNLLGTGDFTRPEWFAEISPQLEPIEGTGLYRLKREHTRTDAERAIRFMLTCEVATITNGEASAKKVHHLLHAPSLEDAEKITDALAQKWKAALAADGRPVLKDCTPAQLVELAKQASRASEVVAAHAWTPWFGVFGSRGGYDSLREAYGDQASRLLGVETGMSSTPAMNWRLSELDKYAILSGSDLHSPYPWRLGRECNAFEFEERDLTYNNIMRALRERNPHFAFTVETDPGYGKYHYDGHRRCGVSLPPEETRKLGGKCPVCKRRLTVGVLARVEELADRPEGYTPRNAVPFFTPLPLHELLAAVHQTDVAAQKVALDYQSLLEGFGNELRILLDVPREELAQHTHEKIADAIMLNRAGKVPVKPGYDGEYGQAQLPRDYLLAEPKPDAPRQTKKQRSLEDFGEG